MAKKTARKAARKADHVFTLRLKSRTVAKLDRLAVDLGISRTSLVNRILDSAVDARMEKAAASLFAVLGVDEVLRSAAETALSDVRKRLG